MDHGSQPKSRLSSVTFAREPLCLNRAGPMLNITSQRQDPEIWIFCHKSILRKIRSHAKTPCAQISFWYIRPFQGYRRKTCPHETETDSRYVWVPWPLRVLPSIGQILATTKCLLKIGALWQIQDYGLFKKLVFQQGCGAVKIFDGVGSSSGSGKAFWLRLRLRLHVKRPEGSGSSSGQKCRLRFFSTLIHWSPLNSIHGRHVQSFRQTVVSCNCLFHKINT